jgi:Outer membrane protein beta-barrel domain
MTGFRINVVWLGLSLSLGATALPAQTPVQFGLGGGASIPSGSTSNGLKTGWHGLALVQFKPASSPVGFRVDGAYNQLGFDGGGGKFEVINGSANLVYDFKVSPETKLRPYLIAGGGVYNIKAKLDAGGSASDTRFGVNAGAGVNFGSSTASLFAEGRFHDAFIKDRDDFHYIPITVGVRFGSGGGS